MSEWQLIDTAPKDERTILYAGTTGYEKLPWVSVGRWYDGAWWELNNHPTDAWGAPDYPTHWMPLPDAPK